ncbi:hypothetical protein AGMMS49921_01450 [Endomicrobiia bacterium]|nr:hypothetical protein AGMMS49921_01450 [Endomicrobiia bacterium]
MHMNISKGVGDIGVRQIRDSIATRRQAGESEPIVILMGVKKGRLIKQGIASREEKI